MIWVAASDSRHKLSGLQPFLTMLVFSIFFGNLANVPSDGVPYPIFSYTALIVDLVFQSPARPAFAGGNSHDPGLFSRMILPLASVLAGVVDFNRSW